MKLLLDEHFSPRIARELRSLGHDVVSVKERPDLIGLPDRAIVRRMGAEQRAIVTNDVDDYSLIATRFAATADEHYGLLFTSDLTMPRDRSGIPLFVEVLGALLNQHPQEDALRNRSRWLP